jgi:methionyl-tRNA formyltransferase
MKYNNICVFADDYVGLKTIEHLLGNYREALRAVVITSADSDIYKYLIDNKYDPANIYHEANLYDEKTLAILSKLQLDYIILAWWPKIIKKAVIAIPKVGVVNFHPSLLPYNRGKHYNFWTIVEGTPFGVSLHFVNEQIDAGDIIFQKEIEKTWEDTGESLYFKARNAMIELFIEKFPELLSGSYNPLAQDLAKGSFHLSNEIDKASEISLDKTYTGRELLNLIRARTFPGKPSCYFVDEGKKYCITVSIKKGS